MSKRLYIALLHNPVYNKDYEVITTSVTNLDVHDICRAARTYGVKRYFLVHPLETQRQLIEEIMRYWLTGYGGESNPDRKEALKILELAADLEEVQKRIEELEGQKALTVVTDARVYPRTVSYQEMRDKISRGDVPYLVLFGTGWGLVKEEIEKADFILHPIEADSDYNHLSVRSAVAIILDRLMGNGR